MHSGGLQPLDFAVPDCGAFGLSLRPVRLTNAETHCFAGVVTELNSEFETVEIPELGIFVRWECNPGERDRQWEREFRERMPQAAEMVDGCARLTDMWFIEGLLQWLNNRVPWVTPAACTPEGVRVPCCPEEIAESFVPLIAAYGIFRFPDASSNPVIEVLGCPPPLEGLPLLPGIPPLMRERQREQFRRLRELFGPPMV